MIGWFFGQPISPLAAPLQQEDEDYPAEVLTATAVYLAPSLTAAAGRSGQPAPTTTSGANTTPTRTVTRTPTVPRTTPTLAQATTNAPTSTLEPSVEPTLAAPETPLCIPGSAILVEGTGPANAGYLVTFNGRAVTGGTVRRDGTFQVELQIGREAPGTYPIVVAVRGTREVLADLTCRVPVVATPTPTTGPSSRFPANPIIPTVTP